MDSNQLVHENAALARLGAIGATQQRLLTVLPDLERALEDFLGKPMKPSPAKALVQFGKLPLEHQEGAVKGLEGQLAFIQEAIRNGLTAYNEKSLVRMAMGKLNLFADENIVEKVGTTDVVEIFDSHHTQVYRSYSCFALCNYSIAELVSYPWYELYERPKWVEERLYSLSESIFAGRESHVDLEDKVPKYVLKETMTAEKAAFEMQDKFLSRMVSGINRETYMLSVKLVTPIETKAGNLSFL